MGVVVKRSSVAKAASKPASSNPPSREEVNATLDNIFDSVSLAIKKNERNVTLEDVDKTLGALFEAVNKVHDQGNKVKLPDFNKILSES